MHALPCLFALAVALSALTACDGYDSNIGPTPYQCAEAKPRCPDGYSCQEDITTGEQVCVGRGGVSNTEFNCADDSAIEPNGMLDVATAASLDGMRTFAKDGLAICPAGDKDLFAITIGTMNENVELIVEFQADGALSSARSSMPAEFRSRPLPRSPASRPRSARSPSTCRPACTTLRSPRRSPRPSRSTITKSRSTSPTLTEGDGQIGSEPVLTPSNSTVDR